MSAIRSSQGWGVYPVRREKAEPSRRLSSHTRASGRISISLPYSLATSRKRSYVIGKARLAPVSRQGFTPQILAEQFIHFIRELL
jgi:hypothetical protein